MLLLYTDGLIEHRRIDLGRRLEHLVDTLAAQVDAAAEPGASDELAAGLMQAMDPRGDDVAILTAMTSPFGLR